MRKLDKGPEPAILTRRGAQWLADLRLARRSKDLREFSRCQGKYSNKSIRNALNQSHRDKCVYCESLVAHIAPTHIEHFRPKGRYASLTFSWANLFLSCPVCNDGGHKGTKFPKVADGGPIVKPDVEEPSDHFDFLWDPITSTALVRPKTQRGETTCKLLGLNRINLVKYRSEYLKKLLLIKTYAFTDAEAAELVDEALNENAPFQAFARAYLT